jgi:hypothetical protein
MVISAGHTSPERRYVPGARQVWGPLGPHAACGACSSVANEVVEVDGVGDGTGDGDGVGVAVAAAPTAGRPRPGCSNVPPRTTAAPTTTATTMAVARPQRAGFEEREIVLRMATRVFM